MNVILLVVALATPVDAPKADLPTVAAASAAVAVKSVVPPVAAASVAVPSSGGVLPMAVSAAGCALVDLFRGDAGFLSGPWSAARRLGSARRRGDADAALRLSATLDALLAEALAVGELP